MVTIKPKLVIRMKVVGECPSHSLTNISVRDVTTIIDEPEERGGTNLGPSPTETAVSALAGCTNTIGNKCAKKLGVDIGNLTITATCQFDRRGVTLTEEIEVPFKSIDLVVEADGPASDEELQAVAHEVKKYCPLSKLFIHAGTEITETWKKAE